MAHVTTFENALFFNKRIRLRDWQYGLVVDVTEDRTIVAGNGLHSTDQKFEKGTWLTFKKEGEDLKDIKVVEDQTLLPQAILHNGKVSVMSKAAAPNANPSLNPIAENWRYLAWSTEWNTIGDPHLLFARFSKEKIFHVRLVYMPGQQPAAPFTNYLWKIVEIFNCFEKNAKFQIIRAPWNIGKQQVKLDTLNETKKTGVIYKTQGKIHFLASEDGTSLPILGSSLKNAKIGQFVEYSKTVELGVARDRAFINKVMKGSRPGRIRTISKEGNEMVKYWECQFKLHFHAETMKNLEKIEFSVKDVDLGKIYINTEELKSECLKVESFKNSGSLLKPGIVLQALAAFAYSTVHGRFIWKFTTVLDSARF